MKFYQIRSVHVFRIMLFAIVRMYYFMLRSEYNGAFPVIFFKRKNRRNKAIQAESDPEEYLLRYRHPPNKPHPLKFLSSTIFTNKNHKILKFSTT